MVLDDGGARFQDHGFDGFVGVVGHQSANDEEGIAVGEGPHGIEQGIFLGAAHFPEAWVGIQNGPQLDEELVDEASIHFNIAEKSLKEARVFLRKKRKAVAHIPEGIFGIGMDDLRQQALLNRQQRRLIELGTILEIAVDRLCRGPELPGDIPHRVLLFALSGNEFERGLEDPLPRMCGFFVGHDA